MLKEITFTVQGKKYTMKQMLGYEDLLWTTEYTDAMTGKVNMERLWFRRLNLTIVSPPLDDATYKQLTRTELEALRVRWQELNQVDPNDFLEQEKQASPISSTSTAPSS